MVKPTTSCHSGCPCRTSGMHAQVSPGKWQVLLAGEQDSIFSASVSCVVFFLPLILTLPLFFYVVSLDPSLSPCPCLPSLASAPNRARSSQGGKERPHSTHSTPNTPCPDSLDTASLIRWRFFTSRPYSPLHRRPRLPSLARGCLLPPVSCFWGGAPFLEPQRLLAAD